MKILNYFKCSCGAIARQYKGLESGLYIGAGTVLDCPNHKDKDHDFIKVTSKKEIKELNRK